MTWTADRLLRHVTYMALRADQSANEVRRQHRPTLIRSRGGPENFARDWRGGNLGPRGVRHNPKVR
jgi:hypothetical protein